jgi:DNA primase
MARIAQDIIDRVRDSANIVDVISQYIDLRKRGQNFVGLCPFHNDTHPSLYVSPAKEIYKCFACGAGGNAFTFLMEYDKISFVDAVKQLGDRYGIEIKLSSSEGDKDLYANLFDIHSYTTELYHSRLLAKSNAKILQYLLDRGLTDETIKNFKIGYSYTEWEKLLQKVKAKKFSDEVIRKSGLFTKSDKGIYDRFRNRIMFPIYNQSGKVIAFGGRTMDKDEPAKYINSPDTPLYHKSDILYGLHLSRQPIRQKKSVVLVEGYMDLIQLYQSGITNVVAASGTALTERHVQQIKKFTNRSYLAYDGDQAGIDATIRAGYLLLHGGVEPLILKVPKGKDPDDWVREVGADGIRKTAKNAQSLINFVLDANKIEQLSSTQQSELINDIVFNIARIRDSIVRNSILKNIAQRVSIDERELIQRVKKEQSRQRIFGGDSIKESQPFEFSSVLQKAQLLLVKMLASEDPGKRQLVRDQLDLELISEPLLKKLSEQLMPLYDEIKYSSIIDQFEEKQEKELIANILMEEYPHGDPEKEIEDCIIVLKSQPIKEKIKAVRFKIRELEESGKDPLDAVMEEAMLQQELKALSTS